MRNPAHNPARTRSAPRLIVGVCAFLLAGLVTTGTQAAITEFLFSTEEPLVANPSGGTSARGDKTRLRAAEIGKYVPKPDTAAGESTSCTGSFFDGSNPVPALDLLDQIVDAITNNVQPPAPAYSFGGHLDAVHALEEVFADPPDVTSTTLAADLAGFVDALNTDQARETCTEGRGKQFLISTDEFSQIIDVPLANARIKLNEAEVALAASPNDPALQEAEQAAQDAYDELEATLRSHPGHVYLFESLSKSATLYLDRRDLFWDQPHADIDAVYQGAGAAGSDAVVFSVDESVALYDRDVLLTDTDPAICEGAQDPEPTASLAPVFPEASRFASAEGLQSKETGTFASLWSYAASAEPPEASPKDKAAPGMDWSQQTSTGSDGHGAAAPRQIETPVATAIIKSQGAGMAAVEPASSGGSGAFLVSGFSAGALLRSAVSVSRVESILANAVLGVHGTTPIDCTSDLVCRGTVAPPPSTVSIQLPGGPEWDDTGLLGIPTSPEYGEFTTVDADAGTYLYTRTAAVTTAADALDSFSVSYDRGLLGLISRTIQVTADIPPMAVGDSASTKWNSAVTVAATATSGVLSNDTDADGDALVVSAVNGVLDDVGRQITLVDSGALLTLNSDGSFTYDPNGAFAQSAGGTDTFDYTVSDGHGGTDTATVTITIEPNNPPEAVDDSASTNARDPVTVAAVPSVSGVLSNDSDLDGDALVVSAVNGVAGGVGALVTLPSGALVTLNSDGSFTYDPAGKFSEAGVDTFEYTVSDGVGGSDIGLVTITIEAPRNTDPVVSDDVNQTDANTPITVAAPGVLLNDIDVDSDPLTVRKVSEAASNVGAQINVRNGSLLTLNADGSYAFDPNGGFDTIVTSEDVVVTYDIDDGFGGSDAGKLTITVLPAPNLPPVANPDTAETGEGSPLIVAAGTSQAVLFNDTDPNPGDTLTVTEVQGDPVNLGAPTPTNNGGAVTLQPDGSYRYDPLNITGPATDTFTYTVSDGRGETAEGTVTITITPEVIENQPPLAAPQQVVVAKDVAQTITLVATDVDDLPTVLTYQITAPTNGPKNGTLSAVSGNQVVYTPNPGYLGGDSFTFTAKDDSGATSDPATVTITVIGTCASDTYTQQEIHTRPAKEEKAKEDAESKSPPDNVYDPALVLNDYAPNKVPGNGEGVAAGEYGSDSYNTQKSNREGDLPPAGGTGEEPLRPAGRQYPLSPAGTAGTTGPDEANFADPNDIIQYSKALGTSRLLFDLDKRLQVDVWDGSAWVPAPDDDGTDDVPDADQVNITGVHINEFFIDAGDAGDAGAVLPKPVVCQAAVDGDPTRTVDLDACPILFSVDRPVRLTLRNNEGGAPIGAPQIFTEKDVIMYQPLVNATTAGGLGVTGSADESLSRYDDYSFDEPRGPSPPTAGDLRNAFDGDVGREQIYGLSLEALADPGPLDISAVLPNERTVYFTSTSQDQLATTTGLDTFLDLASREVHTYRNDSKRYPNGTRAEPDPFGHDHDADGVADTPSDAEQTEDTLHIHHFNFDAVHRESSNHTGDGVIIFSTQDPIIFGDGVEVSEGNNTTVGVSAGKNEEPDLFRFNPADGSVAPYDPFTACGDVTSAVGFPPGDVDAYSQDPSIGCSVFFSLSLPDSIEGANEQNNNGGVLWPGVMNGEGNPIHRGDIVYWDPSSRRADIVFKGNSHFKDLGEDIDAVHWLGPELFLLSVGGDGAEIQFGSGKSAGSVKIRPEELAWVQMDKGKVVEAILITDVKTVGPVDDISFFEPEVDMPAIWQPPARAERNYVNDPYSTPGETYSDSPLFDSPLFDSPVGINLDAIWVTPNPDIADIDHFEVEVPNQNGVSCSPLEAIIRAAGVPTDPNSTDHQPFNYQGVVTIIATDGADSTTPVPVAIALADPDDQGLLVDEGLINPDDPSSCDAGTLNDGKVCYAFPSGGATDVNVLVTPLQDPPLGSPLEINLDVAEFGGDAVESFVNGAGERVEDESMFFQGVRLAFCEGPAPGEEALRAVNTHDVDNPNPNDSNAKWCNDSISVQISDKSSDELPSHGHLYLGLVSGEGELLDAGLCAGSLYDGGTVTAIRMAYECVDPSDDPAASPTSCDGNPADPAPTVTIEGVSADGSVSQEYSINQLKDPAGYTEVQLASGPFTGVGPHWQFGLRYPEAGVLRLHTQIERLVPITEVDPTTGEKTLGETAPGIDPASYPTPPTPEELEEIQFISGASNDFLIRPFAYRFSSVTDATGNENPKGYSTGGDGFIAAGEEFKFSLTAVAWQDGDDVDDDGHPDVAPWPDGYRPSTGLPADADEHRDVLTDLASNSVTGNFTTRDGTGSVSLTTETVSLEIDGHPGPLQAGDQPANFTPTGTGRVAGDLNVVSPADNSAGPAGYGFSGGSSGSVTATYDEVGSVVLGAVTREYFGSDITVAPTYERQSGVGPDNDIMGFSDVIGRFYPHDFAITGSFSEAGTCQDGFIYMDEPAAIDVAVNVTAANVFGDVTTNYDDSLSYVYTANLSDVLEDSNRGTDISGRMDIDLSGMTWSDGETSYAAPHTFYNRYDPPPPPGPTTAKSPQPGPDGPFEAVRLGVQLSSKSDGNGGPDPVQDATGWDMNAATPDDPCPATGAGACDAKQMVPGALRVIYGRAKVTSVAGSELEAMPVPVRTEYWNGTTFVQNEDDQCTAWTVANFDARFDDDDENPDDTSAGPAQGDLNVPMDTQGDGSIGSTQGSLAAGPVVDGDAGFEFSPPGEGNTGDVYLKILPQAWLLWGVEDPPEARITFGKYAPKSRVIYWLERLK